MEQATSYIGNELELFANALQWKAYFARKLGPSIQGDVLEVGAGLGGTTKLLCSGKELSWTCLEPDPQLCARIDDSRAKHELPKIVRSVVGTLADVGASAAYDTILYIDVLEHIENDHEEVKRALSLLRPKGRLIVLAPAHQRLFTPFDTAIGHFRRYDRSQLRALPADGAVLERCFYLDSVGMLASLCNKLLLRQSHPRREQILFWDRAMVPVSRLLDPVFGFALGKSVIGIWRKS